MVVSALDNSFKRPYSFLAEGAGKFRETRTGAIVCVIINVFVSVVCVIKFGFIGVVIGAVCSGLIRTAEYAIFSFKNLLHHSCLHLLKHALITVCAFALCLFVGKAVCFMECTNYLHWVINATCVTVSSAIIVLIVSAIFYREELLSLFGNLKKKIKKAR